MKIEKVNDHQIRCTLTREDLANREIKISELAYGTDKAKSLFRDMMQQAAYECGFEAEDIPLMIEAIPLNSECIVLIVTKVEDPEELDTRFSKFAPSVHDEEDLDEEDLLDPYTDGADEVLNMLRKLNQEETPEDTPSEETAASQVTPPAKEEVTAKVSSQIFTFPSLNEVTRLAHVVNPFYQGANSLYKDESSGNYLLLLSSADTTAATFNRVCNTVSEYGSATHSVLSTMAYLEEHFEPLIKEHAIEVLAGI